MFEKTGQGEPEWTAMPVEENPPGGFPIVFSYPRRLFIYFALLIGVLVCVLSFVGWYLGSFPHVNFMLAAVVAIPLLMLGYNSIFALQVYSDHFMLGLQKNPYRDIMAITVQTTRAGYPIRMSVKTASRTFYLEGFVCMDVLVRELLTRAMSENAGVNIKIQRGPTGFQLKLLFASITVICIFLLLSHFDASLQLWAAVGTVTYIGTQIVILHSQKDALPKSSPRASKWERASTIFLFIMPFIVVGVLLLVGWCSIHRTL